MTHPAGVTLRITGTVPTGPTAVPLYASWNLVGHTRLQALPLPSGLLGLTFGIDVEQVAQYDSTSSTWVFYPGALSQLIPQAGYWAWGLRQTTWTIPAENQTTRFVYDGDGGRVKVLSPTGTTVFVGSSYELGPDGTRTKSVFAGSQRVATKPATGSLRFFHPDHLGSTHLVTDGAGAVLERLEYTPYGGLAPPAAPATTGSAPWRFTGQRLDATGLYFYHARYYDPQLGRFLQADTLVPAPSDPQALNRYSYVRNNPVNYTDPSGHSLKSFFKKFGSAILQTVGVLAAPFTGGASLWLTAGGLAWSGAQAAQAGQFGAWAAGFGASLLTAGVASAYLAPAMAGFLAGGSAVTAGQAAFITGAEFGLAGAAGGFAGALAGGAGFGGAARAAGLGFGAGALTGGAIGYSYAAGWQGVLHGFDTKKYNALYGQLNTAERAFVKHHPVAAYKMMQSAEQAFTFAVENVGGRMRNSPGDAVRHALWGGLSSRGVGEKLATEFTSLHEFYSNSSPLEMRMDLVNNHIGIALGVDQARRSVPVEKLVMDAYRQGDLQTSLHGN